MTKLDRWLAEYAVSHQHPVNKAIHMICVPAIMWSLLGVLWLVPMPEVIRTYPWLNAATCLVGLTIPFYLSLNIKVATYMLLLAGICFCSFFILKSMPLLTICITVFIVAWIGQFIGHTIEGEKPSFFQDIFFLLIGPIWTLRSFKLPI